jgi:hypothetical protein
VKTDYHVRLGGQWAQTGSGPVATWFAKTAYLRHRVVRAGYRPSLRESAESLEATAGLEKFVADKLSTPSMLRAYPATALALVGEGGLRRRNRSDAEIAALLSHARNWMADFVLWNAKVITLRNEQ